MLKRGPIYNSVSLLQIKSMATQLADRGPHPDLQSSKFGPSHFLEFDLGVREGTSVFWS